MPVVIVAAAIAAAAALIGAAIASSDMAKADAIRADIAKKIGATQLPVLDRIVAQKLPPEAAARYMERTRATDAQDQVLGKFMESVNEKGETADDRAAYLRMQNTAGGIANSAQSATNREMANRGLAGSGMAFALKQQGAQNAVNRANQMGIEAASAARGRSMDALGQAGQMSGQMRGQELSAMRAQDDINMFNARQQTNADLHNQNIAQQNFDNEMSLKSAEANALNGVANSHERAAQATRETAGGIGSAAITAGAAVDQYGNPVKKKKDYRDSAGYSDEYGGQDW